MRSSRLLVALTLLSGLGLPARAGAQAQPQGYAVERFTPSAPGAGWLVMDALDMQGGLGGVMALTVGYARDPLRVTDGATHLGVVTDQAFAGFGFAATYDRLRLSLDLSMPLLVEGNSGTVGGYAFTGPRLDLGTNPDTLADVRIGLDARLVGDAHGPFRLGAGAQLIAPSGPTASYVSDGTYRAMGRVLFAGDVGAFAYAGHVGVHLRPRDDTPVPGPQGSELLFGLAAGPRVPLGASGAAALVVGPEIFGETALRSPFGADATGLEALLSSRVEGTAPSGRQVRVRLGVGPGVVQRFGAPEWRVVLGVEVFDRAGRD